MDADGSNVSTTDVQVKTSYDENVNLQWVDAHTILFQVSTDGIYRYNPVTNVLSLVVRKKDTRDFRVLPDGKRFLLLVGDYYEYGCFIGTIGTWALERLTNDMATRHLDHLAIDPDGEGFAAWRGSEIYWYTFDDGTFRKVYTSQTYGISGVEMIRD
jgi:hypothetical protein